MNKTEFIKRLAKRSGHTQPATEAFLNHLFDEIITELCEGEVIPFTNFMTFSAEAREPRRVRNPKTGETFMLPSVVRLSVKASPRLMTILNGSGDLPASGLTKKDPSTARHKAARDE